MSLRAFFQDRPMPYVWVWKMTEAVLLRLSPLFRRVGVQRSSNIIRVPELILKEAMFECQECGQCLLHYNGMTCPMNCPKQLRNGPCGGVRLNGKCEVKPEMDCVWFKGIERAAKTPYRHEVHRLNPPVDWRMHGMASWVTMAVGDDQVKTGSEQGIRYATEAIAPQEVSR